MNLLRQPVLHFVALGVALFAIDAARSPNESAVAAPTHADAACEASTEIVVDQALLDTLSGAFEAEIGRPPTVEELEALVDSWTQEEALRREALALGLDENDPIIRRRLVQNMRFVLESTTLPPEPTDEAVDAWIAENLPSADARARLDFSHVFVDTARNPDAASVADALRAQLIDGAEPAGLGDSFIRGRNFRNVGRAEIARLMGDAAAQQVLDLPETTWSEPIESSFGLHIVRVAERRVPPASGTDAERNTARRALQRATTEGAERDAVATVVSKYNIVRETVPEGSP